MNKGSYFFEFLTDDEKAVFRTKQLMQGRNEKHYFEMTFFSFHEFIVSAFRLNSVDYKYWTEIANRNIDESKTAKV